LKSLVLRSPFNSLPSCARSPLARQTTKPSCAPLSLTCAPTPGRAAAGCRFQIFEVRQRVCQVAAYGQGLPCLHLAVWEVWESSFERMKEMRGRFDAILATAVCLLCPPFALRRSASASSLSILTSLFQYEFPSHVCCFNPDSSSFTRWSRGGQQTYAA